MPTPLGVVRSAPRVNTVAARYRRREIMALLMSILLGAGLAWCLANDLMLPAVGLLGAFAYGMLAWRSPGIALAIMFAAAVFQSDISGGGPARYSPAEAFLGLLGGVLIVRCLVERRIPAWGPVFWPCMLYMFLCALSFVRYGLGNYIQKDATISMLQMVLYFFVAVGVFSTLPRRHEELRNCFYLLAALGTFLAVGGAATNYGFLGGNKNGIGASLACSLLVTAELWMGENDKTRRVWLLAGLVIIAGGLFGSLSRGAWLGTTCGLLLLGALRRQWNLMLRVALLLLPIFVLGWLLLPPESKEYAAGFGKEHMNIKLRFVSVEIARFLWEHDTIFGYGVGWRKEYDATNLVWLLLAETGITGLVAFALIHVVYLRSLWQAQKKLRRDDPIYTPLVVGGALLLYKLAHGMVDHYWSRGAVTLAWCACGMSGWALAEMGRRAWHERRWREQNDPWFSWMNQVAAARGGRVPLAPQSAPMPLPLGATPTSTAPTRTNAPIGQPATSPRVSPSAPTTGEQPTS